MLPARSLQYAGLHHEPGLLTSGSATLPKDAKSIPGMNSPPAPVTITILFARSCAILRDPVESIDELGVVLYCENERPTVGIKLDNVVASRPVLDLDNDRTAERICTGSYSLYDAARHISFRSRT